MTLFKLCHFGQKYCCGHHFICFALAGIYLHLHLSPKMQIVGWLFDLTESNGENFVNEMLIKRVVQNISVHKEEYFSIIG